MGKDLNNFELDFQGDKIQVQRRSIGGTQTLFRVTFSNGLQPLVLTRATSSEIGKHWTSIPEGRFDEAQQIGPLIEEYFR